jgi:Mycotoxin biosynthesis protein UstYa
VHTDDPLIVPDADAEAAGIEENRFHVSERYGGPGYPAFVAGLHQLHCLVSFVLLDMCFCTNCNKNLLRKSLYFNVDYYRALNQSEFLNREETLQLHIGVYHV